MAGSLNAVTLIGRVGQDPRIKHTPSGVAICDFSLATSKRFKKKGSDEYEEKTCWHNVVIWQERGESAHRLIRKGALVCITGEIDNRSWEGEDGQKKYRSEVVAGNFVLLEKKQDGEQRPAYAAAAAAPSVDAGDDDVDLPV